MRGRFSRYWSGSAVRTPTETPERLMEPDVVNPADVLDHRQLELRSGAPDAVGDQLGLEAVDERLGERVLVGVTDRADRGQHAVIGQRLGVVDRGVLATAIGVVDELDVGAWAALPERHPQRVERERGGHMGGELPADDL